MKIFLKNFYSNHVLANLFFFLVLGMGFMSFKSMPRQQDPSINFNWIQISTVYPGASAGDVEKLITKRLEEAINNISDIKFVSSSSRESVSSILVRFEDLSSAQFDKHVNDLRREVQNKESELPDNVESPRINEITSSNAFPTATLVVTSDANDERLRLAAKAIKEDIERFNQVDSIDAFGLHAPELQVVFDLEKLNEYGLSPVEIANTLSANFNDVAAGTVNIGANQWLLRWVAKDDAYDNIKKLPIITATQELQLAEIANVQRGRAKKSKLVNYQNRPAILLAIKKKANTNTIELVEEIKNYLENYKIKSQTSGINLNLLDDQTEVTRNALDIMNNNALMGLILVLFTTWVFLGFKIAFLVSIGIPFTLSGTFWILDSIFASTLNVSVLLGVVITLGMLVDDSVVVVESIYYRLNQGQEKLSAILDALQEIFAPVTASVLTTIAAFTPLMLLPGILGKFMLVIPLVVTLSLTISLIEAYWMLPAHIAHSNIGIVERGKIQLLREKMTRWLRTRYTGVLIRVFKNPKKAFTGLLLLFALAITLLSMGLIKINFFASDPLRIFYINVEMPPGKTLQETLDTVNSIESKARGFLKSTEMRSIVSYAGVMFSNTEPFLGDNYGQISISLHPMQANFKTVDEIVEDMRASISQHPGPLNISFFKKSGGPPTSVPIQVKVRGNDFDNIRQAVLEIKNILFNIKHVSDVADDDSLGRSELILKPNNDAIHRALISPADLARSIRLLVDGEVVSEFQHNGEKVEVRLKAKAKSFVGIKDILQQNISLSGRAIRLSELAEANIQPSMSNIRHYNFRRAITVSADIDKEQTDTVSVNNKIIEKWQEISTKYPEIDLNFSGQLDDIQESLEAMPKLFLLGLGIIYVILGTQFRSYWQPFLILITIPLAFTGVIFGLIVTKNPLSLYTLYGIVALSGITINSSIVLISAANQRRRQGMSLMHATLFAARRRLIPILITSTTTIAGLFSLATGFGGASLVWGPVATAIVWGLIFSTILTLLFVPLLYKLTQK